MVCGGCGIYMHTLFKHIVAIILMWKLCRLATHTLVAEGEMFNSATASLLSLTGEGRDKKHCL